MKKTSSRKTEEQFEAWWNRVFFRTHRPYYKNYRELYYAGANLDYVRSLHVFLEVGDAVQERARQEVKEAKRGKKKRRPTSPPALPAWLEPLYKAYFKAYFEGRLEVALEKARRINPEDPWVVLPLSNPLSPPLMPPPITPRGRYISARVKQFCAETAQRAVGHTMEFLQKEQEKEQEHKKRQYAALVKANPIVEVFKIYAPPPWSYHRGGRHDLLGSFFLLAVTEHLGKKRGKHLLAARLLKSIRGQTFATGSLDRLNAKGRVGNLKKSHRGKWESHLKAVKKQLALMGSSTKSTRS